MTFDLEKMYALLPAYVRTRDIEQGKPLKAVLSVIAEQVAVVEDDLDHLYDDLFIETCAEWVVPYIGDLVAKRRKEARERKAQLVTLRKNLSHRALRIGEVEGERAMRPRRAFLQFNFGFAARLLLPSPILSVFSGLVLLLLRPVQCLVR